MKLLGFFVLNWKNCIVGLVYRVGLFRGCWVELGLKGMRGS